MSEDFFAEESPFPFVHTAVPAALYLTTRRPLWSALGIYLFETAERLASYAFPYLRENINDTIVGDPAIGLLAILVFVWIDWLFGIDKLFDTTVCWWRRIVTFVLIGVTSPIATLLDKPSGHFGVLLFFASYVVAILIGFGSIIFAPKSPAERVVRSSLFTWINLIGIYAILATPVASAPLLSVWMRMFVFSALLLSGLLGLNAIAKFN